MMKYFEKSVDYKDVITLLSFNSKYPEIEMLLEDCSDFNALFKLIKKYCSFFDYRLIRHLGNNFGFQKELKDYKRKFQKYAKRRVCQCPLNAFGEVEGSEKVYKIKIEGDIKEEFTLEDIKKLEYEMNKILGHNFLRLLSFEEGCLELTFKAFPVDNFTITREQVQSLRLLRVLSISYGDKAFTISNAKTRFSTSSLGKFYVVGSI